MRAGLSLATSVLLLLAGCASPEDTPEAPAAAASEPDVGARAAASEAPGETPTPTVVTMPILLDGNTGTSAVACVMPAGECVFQEAAPGVSGIVIEGLAGTVQGGEIVVSWTASSPATTELSAGFMVMDAEACDGLELAGAMGPSPLTLTFPKMDRPLCAGEVLHLWVSGTNWGDAAGQAYYQVDTDQAFHAEGAFLLDPTG